MKPLVCIYCEGNDTKFAVVTKDKDKVKVLKTASYDVLEPAMELEEGISDLHLEGEELKIEGLDAPTAASNTASMPSLINAQLKEINLSNSFFIPALTEPAIYYHIFEGAKQDKSSKVTQEIIDDIQQSKNVTIDKENLGYVELSDRSLLSVFLTGEVACIKMINSLARFNNKRYYKIPSVKSAEISLAYYVAKRKKFFPDDNSLIVYIGKEYSKLVFLHGRKLKHIGTTLDIGTINLHTYDVYFSKILLEMENGGISSLDNIIVCGEDDSENLILSFYGTFPEANVSRLEFDDLDLTELDSKSKENFSSFSVPIAVANDYFDELEEIHKGINLLPKYVKEDQKVFQFAWHGYLMLPLLFIATFFITQQILSNNKQISELNTEIAKQTILLRQNQEIVDKITQIEGNIKNFDKTQAILDSAAVGTGVYSRVLQHLSDFFNGKKNIWLTRLAKNDAKNELVMEGYSLSKPVLTELAYTVNSAVLKGVFYEELRDKNTYKFTLTFNLSSFQKETE